VGAYRWDVVQDGDGWAWRVWWSLDDDVTLAAEGKCRSKDLAVAAGKAEFLSLLCGDD